MILRLYYTLLVSVLLFPSCDQGKRERQIAEREKAVERREQRIALLEDDYRALLKMKDSLETSVLERTDSTSTFNDIDWPDRVQGDWNSRMVCRSSRCANYVIGDQRNELWRFYADATGSYVQVVNNNAPTRVFSGEYAGKKIILEGLRDSTVKSNITMRVELDDIGATVMRGVQVVTGQDNCEAVFSVELTPREK